MIKLYPRKCLTLLYSKLYKLNNIRPLGVIKKRNRLRPLGVIRRRNRLRPLMAIIFKLNIPTPLATPFNKKSKLNPLFKSCVLT